MILQTIQGRNVRYIKHYEMSVIVNILEIGEGGEECSLYRTFRVCVYVSIRLTREKFEVGEWVDPPPTEGPSLTRCHPIPPFPAKMAFCQCVLSKMFSLFSETPERSEGWGGGWRWAGAAILSGTEVIGYIRQVQEIFSGSHNNGIIDAFYM